MPSTSVGPLSSYAASSRFEEPTRCRKRYGLKMTPEEFVNALKVYCRDGAVSDCVTLFNDPPGRKPSPELQRISKWFKGLPPADRELVVRAMSQAADATLFGVLSVIDGVRMIEDGEEKSEFKLSASRSGNESLISPNETFLHDLLRAKP